MVRAVAALALSLALISAASPSARAADADLAQVRSLNGGEQVALTGLSDEMDLTLADGRDVRLDGVLLPREEPWRGRIANALNRLAGQPVELRFDHREVDRYGHSLAQVISKDGEWLQGKLVADGLARVESFGDNRKMIPALLKIEADARDHGVGLWSDPDFAVLDADAIVGDPNTRLGRFAIVEGRVVSVVDRSNWTFVNFGQDWHTDFTIAVKAGNRKRVRDGGLDLATLAGARVRVRGWIRDWNGPLIEVDHAGQIERLAEPAIIAETSGP